MHPCRCMSLIASIRILSRTLSQCNSYCRPVTACADGARADNTASGSSPVGNSALCIFHGHHSQLPGVDVPQDQSPAHYILHAVSIRIEPQFGVRTYRLFHWCSVSHPPCVRFIYTRLSSVSSPLHIHLISIMHFVSVSCALRFACVSCVGSDIALWLTS